MAIQIGSGVTMGSVTMSDQPLEAVIFGASVGDGSVIAYRWNSDTGWGTQYANPSVLPTGTCISVGFIG